MTTRSDHPAGRRNSVTFAIKDESFRDRTPSVGRRDNQQSRNSSLGKGKADGGYSDSSGSISIPKKFHKLKAPSRHQPVETTKIQSGGSRPQHQNVNYENTYKLSPDRGKFFDSVKISQIIESSLNENLKDLPYDHDKCPGLCTYLAEVIKDDIKASGVQRYKLVTNVILFEDKRQGFHWGSRCLWNPNFDNFATASYTGQGYRAVGACFASYYE